MTKSYTQLVKQIEILKDQAEKARRKEVEGVIGRIREAITAYGISASDLGFGSAPKAATVAAGPRKRRARGTAKVKPAGVVKYSNGNGGTWGGRGKRPQWLRDAINSGKPLSDFLVK